MTGIAGGIANTCLFSSLRKPSIACLAMNDHGRMILPCISIWSTDPTRGHTLGQGIPLIWSFCQEPRGDQLETYRSEFQAVPSLTDHTLILKPEFL